MATYFIDPKGAQALGPFDSASAFHQGLAAASQRERWGWIDPRGEWVIKPRYGHVGSTQFSQGLAAVCALRPRRYGYIDRAGRDVIPPRFASAQGFSDGLAVAGDDVQQSNGKRARCSGYIDTAGDWVVPAGRYAAAYALGEGRGLVQSHEGRFGYVDPRGELVVPATLRQAGFFREGLAAVTLASGAHAVIDPTGRVVFEHSYGSIVGFYNGLARVRVGERDGYVDASGALVIAPRFDYAGLWWSDEGLAAANVGARRASDGGLRGGRWGFIDRGGNWAIEPQFEDGLRPPHFAGGLAVVRKDFREGYVDTRGRWVIAPRFQQAWDFAEGLAQVTE
jgi:hypothetical protein